jgi:uncharacterized membrane protein YfhO
MGFASWFYTYGPNDLVSRITWLQRTDVLVSAGTVLLAAGLYYRLRHRYDYRLVALIALKLYLATFYAFIQIPYPYLTSLGIFISLFLVMMTGAGQANTTPATASSSKPKRAPLPLPATAA